MKYLYYLYFLCLACCFYSCSKSCESESYSFVSRLKFDPEKFAYLSIDSRYPRISESDSALYVNFHYDNSTFERFSIDFRRGKSSLSDLTRDSLKILEYAKQKGVKFDTAALNIELVADFFITENLKSISSTTRLKPLIIFEFYDTCTILYLRKDGFVTDKLKTQLKKMKPINGVDRWYYRPND